MKLTKTQKKTIHHEIAKLNNYFSSHHKWTKESWGRDHQGYDICETDIKETRPCRCCLEGACILLDISQSTIDYIEHNPLITKFGGMIGFNDYSKTTFKDIKEFLQTLLEQTK